MVNGDILGGNGGVRGSGIQVPTKATHGAGGVGIAGSGIHVVLGPDGSISGGLGGDGVTRAEAVVFGGGTNSLELLADTGAITGKVSANGTADTLHLGGTTTGNAFDLAVLGTQFVGFEAYEKRGSGEWSLTGTSAGSTAWSVLAGTLTLPGSLTGSVSTAEDGIFSLAGGVLTGTLDNHGTTYAQGAITWAVTNAASGSFILTGNLAAGGLFTNEGELAAFGTGSAATYAVTGGAGFVNAGRISLHQTDGIAGDVLDLTAAGTFTAGPDSTLYVDVDLADSGALASDQLLLSATSGTLQVIFNPDVSRYGAATAGVRVLQTADGNLEATATGLQDRGLVTYDFREIGTDWYVTSQLNVAPLGGIVAGLATAQAVADLSLPPTEFSTSCVAGVSSSGASGVERTTSSTAVAGGNATTSEVSVGYGRTRFSVDFGCIDLGPSDTTLRVGLVGGQTSGGSSQNQALPGDTALQSSTDFDALYAGIYGQLNAGNLTATGQLGYTDTAFEVTADVLGGTGRLIDGAQINAHRLSATGALAYAIPLDAFTVTTSAGMKVSFAQTDALHLADLGGLLDFVDTNALAAFGGVELGTTVALPDGGGTLRYFASGLLSRELADAQAFTYDDDVNGPVALETATPAARGTLGAGLTYSAAGAQDGTGVAVSLRGDVGYAGGQISTGVTVKAGAGF